jgi:hypothetical protein
MHWTSGKQSTVRVTLKGIHRVKMRPATGEGDAGEEFEGAVKQVKKTGIEVARGEIESGGKIVEAKHAH